MHGITTDMPRVGYAITDVTGLQPVCKYATHAPVLNGL
jgi:hypothetical protein